MTVKWLTGLRLSSERCMKLTSVFPRLTFDRINVECRESEADYWLRLITENVISEQGCEGCGRDFVDTISWKLASCLFKDNLREQMVSMLLHVLTVRFEVEILELCCENQRGDRGVL